jgi:hypothetical protein
LERSVKYSGEAIANLADDLLQLTNGDPNQTAVSIETPRGSLIETLLGRDIPVFSINPKQLNRARPEILTRRSGRGSTGNYC